MYTPRSRRILRFVKRLQFYLEVESDDALGAEAAREGISKAEIIRRLVTNHLGRSVDVDPINDLVGRFDGEPGRATTWCTGHEVRRHLVWVALFFHRAANHATATTLWSGQPGRLSPPIMSSGKPGHSSVAGEGTPTPPACWMP